MLLMVGRSSRFCKDVARSYAGDLTYSQSIQSISVERGQRRLDVLPYGTSDISPSGCPVLPERFDVFQRTLRPSTDPGPVERGLVSGSRLRARGPVLISSRRMDFDSLKDLQSGLGTGAVIVMNKSTDIVAAIARFAKVSTNLPRPYSRTRTDTHPPSVLQARVVSSLITASTSCKY